jgi:hypothetical protein
LKQAVGKPPSRSSDIEANHIRHIHLKKIESGFEFVASSADIFLFANDSHGRIRMDQGSGFIDHPLVDQDLPRKYEPLRAFPRLDIAKLDEQFVDSRSLRVAHGG